MDLGIDMHQCINECITHTSSSCHEVSLSESGLTADVIIENIWQKARDAHVLH